MAFPHIPRFLAPFHPKQSAHRFTDVLILGGGLAGLRAALEVDPRLPVLAVSKGSLSLSNSQWAQGGIASVLDPEDKFENHIQDTLVAGGALCDAKVVEFVVREAPKEVARLIEWGAKFDETAAGKLDLGREGGHSHHRIVHALGDATGREVMRAVIQAAGRLQNLETWENTFILDLLTFEGVCRGAVVWDAARGTTLVWAKQTVLATGGAGQVYRETTNPSIATGDGHAVAYRAGAEMRDMEFFQFHPTVLYIAGMERHLITEAVRGDGAHLLDNQGRRFMLDYDSRGELAPRDVVSRSIVAQMEKTAHPNVYLSLAHLDAAHTLRRFPGMARLCAQFNLDITRDPIPVRPGAHYMIGGATTDTEGRTTLPGLWAAGEVTSTGLHGANRLASNSLLEAMVFGARCGAGASAAAAATPDRYEALPLENPRAKQPLDPLDLSDIQNSLRALMWRNAGILRDESRLAEAAKQVDRWCGYVLQRQVADPVGWQLQNMLVVARLLIEGARQRTESRGTHVRLDYPQTDPAWQRRIALRRTETP